MSFSKKHANPIFTTETEQQMVNIASNHGHFQQRRRCVQFTIVNAFACASFELSNKSITFNWYRCQKTYFKRCEIQVDLSQILGFFDIKYFKITKTLWMMRLKPTNCGEFAKLLCRFVI